MVLELMDKHACNKLAGTGLAQGGAPLKFKPRFAIMYLHEERNDQHDQHRPDTGQTVNWGKNPPAYHHYDKGMI